ncbi:MAG: hypothetical protein HOV66_07830 [Streptomycetaceae bacterium]|nr:hypothetical protein [Streptomycetaceae bacterium]
MSASTISRWERGRRKISLVTEEHLKTTLAAWREGARQ